MSPARSISRWLATSASEGGSFVVGMRYPEYRVNAFSSPPPPRQPLGEPDHLGDDLFLLHLFDNLPTDEEEALPPPSGHSHVGFPGLSGPVHGAPHDRHLQRNRHAGEPSLHLVRDAGDADRDPPAGRAGDEIRSPLPHAH